MSPLLPIGSVVLLKKSSQRLMIIGLLQKKPDEEKIYDYLAVPYPEGYLGDTGNFLFSHDDINDVVFTGYINPDGKAFLELLEFLRGKTESEVMEMLSGAMKEVRQMLPAEDAAHLEDKAYSGDEA